MKIDAGNISRIILAGGKSKRVGGLDKGLVSYLFPGCPACRHTIGVIRLY